MAITKDIIGTTMTVWHDLEPSQDELLYVHA